MPISFSSPVTIVNNGNNNSFPGFVSLPSGALLATWRAASTHTGTGGGIAKSFSYDGGLTWSAAATVIPGGDVDGFDYRGGCVTLLESGDVVMVAERRSAAGGGTEVPEGGVFLRSTDEGATWSAPVEIDTLFTDWGRCMGPILEMANGDLLLTVYGEDTGDAQTSTRVLRSADDGVTWSLQGEVAAGGTLSTQAWNEAGLFYRDDGTLCCIVRQGLNGHWDFATSADDGVTWSALTRIKTNAAGHPQPAKYGNRVVAVFRDLSQAGDPAVVLLSDDEGANWTADATISSTSGDQMTYAQAGYDFAGVLHIAYAYELAGNNADLFYINDAVETRGDTPSISTVSDTADSITVEISTYNHPDGEVDGVANFDPDNPKPYLAVSEIQIKLAADDWDEVIETIWLTYDGTQASRQAEFTGLAANTAYEFRGRQLDGYLGVHTLYSADHPETTDATPTDKPNKATLTIVTCGRDIEISGSAYAHSAVGAGTAHATTQVRICYNSYCKHLTLNSPATTYTWQNASEGTATLQIRYGDSSGRYGDWSDVSGPQTCVVPPYPSVLRFTGPTTRKVSTSQTITWVFKDTSVAWLSNIQRAIGSGAFVAVASNQVAQSTPFTVTSTTPEGIYIYRVQAVNPTTGELGEWHSIALTLSRVGSAVRVYHRNGVQLAAGGGRKIWDTSTSWTGETVEGVGVGLFATRTHSGGSIVQGGYVFDAAGQMHEGDILVEMSHRPNECEWPPYRFANPQVTKGGGIALADGTTSGTRHGRATMLETRSNPWYIHPEMPCATQPWKTQARTLTSIQSTLNPTVSYQYGRSNTQGKLRGIVMRSGTTIPSSSSVTLGNSGDLIGGPFLSTGGFEQTALLQQEVKPAPGGWNVRARLLSPGVSDSWSSSTFIAQTVSGNTIPCGYCGLAYEDMGEGGVGRSLGILFTSFTARVISTGACEPLEEECISGKALVRAISIERHPHKAVFEYMVIGEVTCPPEA